MPSIPRTEFSTRIERIQEELDRNKLDGLIVYGDEYRKENLRYVSNFWPIFERAACFIPQKGKPILAVAPEGEKYASEMCVWQDIRVLREFMCVSVPEEIEYPLATFSSFREIIDDLFPDNPEVGLVGKWDIPGPILERLEQALPNGSWKESDSILIDLRIIKSLEEIACLKEAGRLACDGYEDLMKASQPGSSEIKAAAAGEASALKEGAEAINFMVYGSGERTATIIGRPSEKIIRDGEMIMASLAVQYQGYVATVEFPFVAGKANDEQKRLLSVLFEAADIQQKFLKAGAVSGEMVRAVKNVFKKHHMESYDVYPPMHGIGLAEAESPYPNESSDYQFEIGMCVNSDISLFGHKAGSNRIEEGFVIQTEGLVSLTPLIRELCKKELF